jgi:hypothetical protein
MQGWEKNDTFVYPVPVCERWPVLLSKKMKFKWARNLPQKSTLRNRVSVKGLGVRWALEVPGWPCDAWSHVHAMDILEVHQGRTERPWVMVEQVSHAAVAESPGTPGAVGGNTYQVSALNYDPVRPFQTGLTSCPVFYGTLWACPSNFFWTRLCSSCQGWPELARFR